MKPYDDQLEELARAFSTALQKDLGLEKVEAIVNANELKNMINKEGDERFCHSHDHCDANMVMLEAFQKIQGRPPFFLMETDGIKQELRDQDQKMIDEAWTMASVNSFYLPFKMANQIIEESEVYLFGHITDYGFDMLADIRKKMIGADMNKETTVRALKKDHDMTEAKAIVLVDWAFAVLVERKYL